MKALLRGVERKIEIGMLCVRDGANGVTRRRIQDGKSCASLTFRPGAINEKFSMRSHASRFYATPRPLVQFLAWDCCVPMKMFGQHTSDRVLIRLQGRWIFNQEPSQFAGNQCVCRFPIPAALVAQRAVPGQDAGYSQLVGHAEGFRMVRAELIRTRIERGGELRYLIRLSAIDHTDHLADCCLPRGAKLRATEFMQ
jgi:hypothetical protein